MGEGPVAVVRGVIYVVCGASQRIIRDSATDGGILMRRPSTAIDDSDGINPSGLLLYCDQSQAYYIYSNRQTQSSLALR